MLDIKFKSNLESLEIDNATINLQSNSGLFSAKINNQYISYNFTVVATPNNQRNLKIPHIVESTDNFKDFEILILINNSIELEGILTIEDANSQTIKLSIQSEDLNVDFLADNINTFDYGDDIDIGPNTSDVIAHVLNVNTKDYPDTSHVFPMIHSPEFYGDENTEFLGVVNNYDIVAETLVANTNISSVVKNKNSLVPYFFLVFILKKIFETQNITLKGSFLDHAEIQKVIIHNNLALDEFDIERSFVRASLTSYFSANDILLEEKITFDDDSTFPNEDSSSIYNTTLGEFTIPHEGIINVRIYNLVIKNFAQGIYGYPVQIDIGMYIDGVKRGNYSIELMQNETKTIPEIIISGDHLYDSINGWYYASTETLISAADIGKKIVIKTKFFGAVTNPTPAATIYSGAIVEFNLDKWTEYNIYNKTITPSNHLPSMTADSFVNSFITGFKLMPYYDKIKREMHLDFFEDVITNLKYNDVTDNVSSYVVKKLNNTGFTLNYDLSSDDNFPSPTPDTSKFKYVGEYNCIDDLPSPPTVSLMCYVKSVNAYYVSLVTTGINWVRYKEAFDDLIIEDGSTPYLLSFSPFKMEQTTIDNDGSATMREFLMPTINETGSSFFYKNGINEPMFKLLLWHGMVDGPTALKPYPFASSYNIDHNGNEIGDLSLRLYDNEDSLYYQFLRNYFDFLINTKKVEHIFTPKLKSPLTYNFLEKKLIGNQRYLTGKLKLKVTKRGFEKIVAENYKV